MKDFKCPIATNDIKHIQETTGVNDINEEITKRIKRRWRWLGHYLHMDNTRHTKTAVPWTLAGSTKRGKP